MVMKLKSLWWSFSVVLLISSISLLSLDKPSTAKMEALKVLKEVYAEVKEMGPYGDENYIKRDFFIGWDDDDTNKDEHVVVLIQAIAGVEKMTIQVTYLERTRDNPKIKNAKAVKGLLAAVNKDRVEILNSDYAEKELKGLAAGILKAVLDKKNLLKNIKQTGI